MDLLQRMKAFLGVSFRKMWKQYKKQCCHRHSPMCIKDCSSSVSVKTWKTRMNYPLEYPDYVFRVDLPRIDGHA